MKREIFSLHTGRSFGQPATKLVLNSIVLRHESTNLKNKNHHQTHTSVMYALGVNFKLQLISSEHNLHVMLNLEVQTRNLGGSTRDVPPYINALMEITTPTMPNATFA